MFARRAFGEGEVVEICPVMVLVMPYAHLPKDLRTKVFHWESHPTGKPELARQALALGYGSLYNSSNPANIRYRCSKSELTIEFIAERDIRKGEELTINYSGEDGYPSSNDDSWFVDKGIVPIRESNLQLFL